MSAATRARQSFRRILALVDRQTGPGRTRILAALQAAYRAASVEEIERQLLRGSFLADDGAVGRDVLTVKLRAALLTTLTKIVDVAGPIATEELAVLLDQEINWPTFRSRARRWAKTEAAKRVVEITEEQRSRLRALVRIEESRGTTARAIAKEVREHIGLNRRASESLSTYRDKVGLANERIKLAVASGKMTAADGKAAVAKNSRSVSVYRQRLLRYRAESITRTELIDGVNQTSLNIWKEGKRRGLLSDRHRKEWIAILRDGKICEQCHGLHGQRRKIDEMFEAPDGTRLAAPTKHTRCRCQLRLSRANDPVGEVPPFVEPAKGPGLRPTVSTGTVGRQRREPARQQTPVPQ